MENQTHNTYEEALDAFYEHYGEDTELVPDEYIGKIVVMMSLPYTNIFTLRIEE